MTPCWLWARIPRPMSLGNELIALGASAWTSLEEIGVGSRSAVDARQGKASCCKTTPHMDDGRTMREREMWHLRNHY